MHHIDFNKISTIAIDEVLGPLYFFDVFLLNFVLATSPWLNRPLFSIDILFRIWEPSLLHPFTSNNAL